MQVLKVDFQAADAAEVFDRSLRETGFALIFNHPIASQDIDRVYALWQEFFQSEDKVDYPYDPISQDGYFPMGTETAKGNTVADLKMFYQVYPNGRIPEALREATLTLRTQLYALGETLLGWLDPYIPAHVQTSLPALLSDLRTLYRIIYYPPLTGLEQAGAIRAAAHEDINFMTLIPVASAEGLQVKDISGRWHDVPCDYGNISINVGDMLQMLTRGHYPATTHRVVNPEITHNPSKPRMSMPLFMHPEADVVLKPDFTAEDFLDQRLGEIGIRRT